MAQKKKKKKKKKTMPFGVNLNEKPSIIPGCPEPPMAHSYTESPASMSFFRGFPVVMT